MSYLINISFYKHPRNLGHISFEIEIPEDLESNIQVRQIPLRNLTFLTDKTVWSLIVLGIIAFILSVCLLVYGFGAK